MLRHKLFWTSSSLKPWEWYFNISVLSFFNKGIWKDSKSHNSYKCNKSPLFRGWTAVRLPFAEQHLTSAVEGSAWVPSDRLIGSIAAVSFGKRHNCLSVHNYWSLDLIRVTRGRRAVSLRAWLHYFKTKLNQWLQDFSWFKLKSWFFFLFLTKTSHFPGFVQDENMQEGQPFLLCRFIHSLEKCTVTHRK